MAQTTARLITSGMHCSSCAALVDMTLSELDGVESSKTDHATGMTVVTYDDQTLDLETIMGAIRSVGYEAEPAA